MAKSYDCSLHGRLLYCLVSVAASSPGSCFKWPSSSEVIAAYKLRFGEGVTDISLRTRLSRMAQGVGGIPRYCSSPGASEGSTTSLRFVEIGRLVTEQDTAFVAHAFSESYSRLARAIPWDEFLSALEEGGEVSIPQKRLRRLIASQYIRVDEAEGGPGVLVPAPRLTLEGEYITLLLGDRLRHATEWVRNFAPHSLFDWPLEHALGEEKPTETQLAQHIPVLVCQP